MHMYESCISMGRTWVNWYWKSHGAKPLFPLPLPSFKGGPDGAK